MVEMIDVMRRCWFDMIVQYEAMFVLEVGLNVYKRFHEISPGCAAGRCVD